MVLGLALALASAATCDAGALPTETWELRHLMALMAEIPSTKESFTESKSLAALSEPLRLSGQLSYQRPDRLEKHVLAPFEEHFIVEGNTLTLINKEGKKRIALDRYPVIRAFVESIRATLAGNGDTLRRYYQITLAGDRRNWTLTLKPLEQQMADYVRSIELRGTETHVTRVDVQEAGGDSSVMLIRRDAS